MMPLLYLSSDAIAALRPDARLAREAVEEAFRLKAAGRTRMAPKTAVALEGSDVAMAMVGMLAEPAVAGVKWVGACLNQWGDRAQRCGDRPAPGDP